MIRRDFLQGLAASLGCLAPRAAFAAREGEPRLVWVTLRGGMDGLGAVPAHGDPDWHAARGSLAPEQGVALPLDGTFGLHPALAPLLPLWQRGELLPLHAVATPYAERSHFDGQDVLEGGAPWPSRARSGWLARALATPGSPSAVAVGGALPLILRGAGRATSLDPLQTARPDDAWLTQVRALYAEDPLLGPVLEEGLATQRMLARFQAGPGGAPRGKGLEDGARVMGQLLAAPDGPRVATFDLDGWDTHVGQDATLARRLGELAGALVALADGLGPAWHHTVVMVATEFGRTVAPNGTKGTDHGVASAALLAGGAVRGGRVVADWPGLAPAARLQGRDLRPTLDLRSVCKGVLRDHLAIDPTLLEREVFPDSARARPLDGLVASR